jgi:hypothetical protein
VRWTHRVRFSDGGAFAGAHAKTKQSQAAPPATKTEKAKTKPGPVESIDPVGRPEGKIVKKSARYYIWYDSLGWHLRVTTAGKARRFHGVIRLPEGTIESTRSVDLNEKKNRDFWRYDESKRQLRFEFRAAGGSDGFYFKTRDASEIVFDLKIDNEHDPKSVFIGHAARNASELPFRLPAEPKTAKKKADP